MAQLMNITDIRLNRLLWVFPFFFSETLHISIEFLLELTCTSEKYE